MHKMPLTKIQHPFMMKVLERSGTQGPYLNLTKAIYSKLIASIKLNAEKLKSDFSKIKDKRISTF